MESIASILLDWYGRAGRDLPWRHTRDPYRIWISEVVLQQTRVAQGTDYYLRFTERFPDVESLAAASEDEVLRMWQGLGYYSRARNLHAAARAVVAGHGGRFPASYEAVRALPGVGEYTAAAVCSAAFGLPVAAVDGNVLRVVSRLFDVAEPVDAAAGRRAVTALAQELLDVRRPGVFNQAMMDFGATCCTPARPACAECPLAERCLARAADTVTRRPVTRGRATVSDRWFDYLHITCGGRTYLRRRGAGDIWQGLYEFPLVESGRALDFAGLSSGDAFRVWTGGVWRLTGSVVMPPHRLSHRTIHAVFHRIELPAPTPALASCVAVPQERVGEYAVPRLIENYFSRTYR